MTSGNEKTRLLMYVCPDCESIKKAGNGIGGFCRKKKSHKNNDIIPMRLGELFVYLGEL